MKVKEKIKLSDNTRWTFGGDVSIGFDKHISSSIPLYKQIFWLALEYSDFFLKDKSVVYDLGSSTGTFLKILEQRHNNLKKVEFIGVDAVAEMVKYSKRQNKSKNIKYLRKEIQNMTFKKSDAIFSLYTLQFIEKKNRLKVLDKIYKSLNIGGMFLFSEKIRSRNSQMQDMVNDIYREWKIDQGFTAKEVILKSKSLKGVLDPNTSNDNLQMLKKVGFKKIEVISQYLNFQTILAIKE